MWFLNLLTSASSSESSSPAVKGGGWETWLIAGIGILLVVGMLYLSNRSQKKRQQEMQETLKAIKPGNKVKTIGGICGVVVEICPDENTFVLETGSEAHGKSYIKFDMIAVYQTDAKKEDAPVEEAPAAEVAEPAPAEEVFEETATEETPAEEAKEE